MRELTLDVLQPSADQLPTAADLLRAGNLSDDGAVEAYLYTAAAARPGELRLKVFRDRPVSLSQLLPTLSDLGAEVTDERPYAVSGDTRPEAWIYDLGLRLDPTLELGADFRGRFEDTFLAVCAGACESDGFNALVPHANLSWREASVLRAYAQYLRQAGTAFTQSTLESCLRQYGSVTRLLINLFTVRFDPNKTATPADREDTAHQLWQQIETALDAVAVLDSDRILRSFRGLIEATLRTNYFQTEDGRAKPYLSLKLDPAAVPDLPLPRPYREIFVSSPRVEGVHLRYGPVARGGLRWSDRRDDYRTEVLGLVKAQAVKNAVIVPEGAKGGFVVKQPPAGDRQALQTEGQACYRQFIRGLLDVTDNRVGDQVVPPTDVVRRDGDDPYLVVAADKGTATFSDLANEVAGGYDFWLGDAFASGGSAGYDHKAMGITARGAWESVRRHFRELGRDPQTDPFTVVGVGDMSGDVFGNGMLLSQQIRLVAAFDHRHIFLDPDPDPSSSWAERRRLFELPRSSWADYDPALLSAGGAIHSRTAKHIPLSPEVRARLGLHDSREKLTPAELIRAVLTAPVDLLWNGGIGTYVKAAAETHAEVGDKTNDEVRVDAETVRARVVAEGGNLGLTQLGRIAYALRGGRINTDAIDNSAGVDTSDHEVNIKIALDAVVRDGALPAPERNSLLATMADEVAAKVLLNNREQNLTLALERADAARLLPAHRRLLRQLERRGVLDRALERLPDDAALDERGGRQGLTSPGSTSPGLTSPELSVLLAYVKNSLTSELVATDLADQEWFATVLTDYFPSPLRARYAEQLAAHPLRRQIITTVVVNEVVNRGGITFVFRAQEETGASAADVVRAYAVARQVFAHPAWWAEVEALPSAVPAAAGAALQQEGRRLLDRAVRWLLQSRRGVLDIAGEVQRLRPCAQKLMPRLPELIRGVERDRLQARAVQLVEVGAPDDIALKAAAMLDAFSFLDVADLTLRTGRAASEVAELYFHLSERFGVDLLLTRISELPQRDRWHSSARTALRADLYAALADLTTAVLQSLTADAEPNPTLKRPVEPEQLIEAWVADNRVGLARVKDTLAELIEANSWDLAALSVALRVLRTVARP